jgi:hypothetical protein
MKENIKYPFPAAAILLFVSSFFYFLSIVFSDELPYAFYDLILPSLIRFCGVIIIGVFLLVKRLPVATLISFSSLIIAQFADMVIYVRATQYYLAEEDTIGLLFKNLFLLISLVFVFLLSFTNVVSGSFKKFSKVWFIGIILSSISYFLDFVVMATYSEYFPADFEDIIFATVFGNIFSCIALCLVSGWFKKVVDSQSVIEESVYIPEVAYVMPVSESIYTQPIIDSPKESINKNDDADELRKYKALFDEGVITEEEFELKKKKILDI